MTSTFPTPLHQQVTAEIVAWFQHQPETEAVLLVNSCARGKATPQSDLDLAVLVKANLPLAEVQAAGLERVGEPVWAAEAFDDPTLEGFAWFFVRAPDGRVYVIEQVPD